MSGDLSNTKDLSNIITAGVITLSSGLLSAFITNILSTRRSIAEKLWELRRSAYGTILAELKQAELVIDQADEYIQEDLYRYYSDEISAQHSTKISRHMALAQKSYQDNYLILSDQFILLFEDLLRSFEELEYLSPPEIRQSIATAIRTARPKLAQQGRSEMPVRPSLWSRLYCVLKRSRK